MGGGAPPAPPAPPTPLAPPPAPPAPQVYMYVQFCQSIEYVHILKSIADSPTRRLFCYNVCIHQNVNYGPMSSPA